MKDFQSIIDSMPVGLERTVARLITFHRGENHLITREELLKQVRLQASLSEIEDRQMRLAIQELRNRGDRKSTRLNSSHIQKSRMPSSA